MNPTLLAESQFTPPMQIAGWLGCLSFTIWIVLMAVRLVKELKDKPAPSELQRDTAERYTPKSEFSAHATECRADRAALRAEMIADRRNNEVHASTRSKTIFDQIDKVRTELSTKHDELRGEMQRNFQDTERALGRIEGKIDERLS